MVLALKYQDIQNFRCPSRPSLSHFGDRPGGSVKRRRLARRRGSHPHYSSSGVVSAAPSGAIITGFKPKSGVITFGIVVTSDGVYSAHGGQGGKLNAYTTTGALRWSATFDGDAQAVTALDDTVYVGGHFDNACKSPRTGDQGVCLDGSEKRIKLAALDAADGSLRTWTADANGVEGVLAMARTTDLGVIAAGGAFTLINGASRKRLAQFGRA